MGTSNVICMVRTELVQRARWEVPGVRQDFFGLSVQLTRLWACSDPRETTGLVANFEALRSALEEVLSHGGRARGASYLCCGGDD